jgi:uncharacterized protein
MIQLIIELPEMYSKKDKRRIVNSLKQKLQNRYKVSAAEIDLHESLTFTQIGAALVSNSRQHGERVMQKILTFVEDDAPGRVQDVQIYSEFF